MNFDLSQLLQGPVRDLVLNQVTKQFGISNEAGGNLLTKGLSMVLGGMSHKASSAEGATGLFNLIKNTALQGSPLDMLTGKAEGNGSQLLEMGKNILPNLFGDKADSVISHLSHSTNTTPVAAKGMLGMLVPVAFSFFKNKIASGLGLGGFAKLLGEQTKAVSSHLDTQSLSALGFAGGSIDNVISGINKVSHSLGGAAAAGAATVGAAAASTKAAATAAAKPAKSGLGKWLLPAAVLLAALLGLKTCTGDKAETTATAQPAAQAQPAQAAPAAETATPAAESVDGLGDLAWARTDKDFTLSGTVQNDGVKAGLLDAFKGLAGDLPLVDKLTVDANAPKFGFDNFAGLTGLMKEFPGVDGAFAGKAFNLVGKVAGEDAKAVLAEKAKALLGEGFNINTDGVNVEAATPAAETAPAPAQEAPAANTTDGLGNLGWVFGEKDVTVSGNVQNDAAKAGILEAFKGLAGDLPLVDKLAIDANAPQFNFNNFAGLADLAKAFPAVNGSFADKIFNLAGKVANDDAKTALINQAKALLGDAFTINADNVTVEAPAAAAPAANNTEEAGVIADMSAEKLDLEIVFDSGSAIISPRYHNRLNAFAKFLVENNRRGEIAGYTDNTGDAGKNQKLSEQRAVAVREYLVQQGVPAESLTAVGYGDKDPIADNSTVEGRHKNRRIEFNAR